MKVICVLTFTSRDKIHQR